MGRRVTSSVVVVVVVMLACGLGAAAGAHTSVRTATPGPGETVTGPVEEVRIEFLDAVQDGTVIELTDPAGDPVAPIGDPEVLDDASTVVQAFEPSDVAGDHRVDYRYTALDGAAQSGAYEFAVTVTVTGGADDGGVVDLGVVAMAVVAVVVVASGFSLWRRRR